MTEPNLFGIQIQPPAKRARAPVADGAVTTLIHLYVALYSELLGEKPLITKKDGALLKRLVITYGATVVEERLRVYLAWPDPYIRARGYTLALLYSKWQEVAALAHQTQPRPRWTHAACPHVEMCATAAVCETMTILGRPVK